MKADKLNLQETVFLKDVLIICLWLSIAAAAARKRVLSLLLCSVFLVHGFCPEGSLLFRLALFSSRLGHCVRRSYI